MIFSLQFELPELRSANLGEVFPDPDSSPGPSDNPERFSPARI